MHNGKENESGDSVDRTHLSIVGVVVKTRIRAKIIRLVIAICLFSLLSMSIASYFTIKNTTDYSGAINTVLGNSATNEAKEALVSQAHQFLRLLAQEQSRNCNGLLNTIKFDLELIVDVTEDIFNSPHLYDNNRPVIRPSEAIDGVFCSTYSLPVTVTITPEIQRELDLISNLSLLMPTLTNNPDIIELYVGMESGLFYNYTPVTFENPEYDPRTRPWYIKAVENPDEVVFTDVYEDAFGTGMVLTAAKAVFDNNGKLLGVAALDILLQNLKDLALDMRITESGYAFIINNEGTYIVHPEMGAEDFVSNVKDIRIAADSGLSEGFKRMMNGETGFITDEADGQTFFMTFSPISVSGWSIGVLVYEEEILSALQTLSSQMDSLTKESEKNISAMTVRALIVFIAIFLIVAVMVAVLSMKLSHLVSKPIQKLTDEVVKIGEGDFEYRIPVESHDEIGFLTSAFNSMADNLFKYAQNIIMLDRQKSELEVISNTDALTGIMNRRCFLDTAAKHLDFAVRTNKSAYVVMFDIDHFKRVNDTYGHPAGDAVLINVAETVGNLIRPHDIFARFGGEEFIMAFTDISKTSVINLVERIRQELCKVPVEFEDASIPISASFGIAPVSLENVLDGAIASADESLYKAKNTGRNKSVFSE